MLTPRETTLRPPHCGQVIAGPDDSRTEGGEPSEERAGPDLTGSPYEWKVREDRNWTSERKDYITEPQQERKDIKSFG